MKKLVEKNKNNVPLKLATLSFILLLVVAIIAPSYEASAAVSSDRTSYRKTSGKQSVSRKKNDSRKVSFGIKFDDEVNVYDVMSAFLLPGETLNLEATLTDRKNFSVAAEGGKLLRRSSTKWRWTAPKTPGIYSIVIRDKTTHETMTLQAFVMVPYKGQSVLNGYRIGSYGPSREGYQKPTGFVEVTPQNQDTQVSPHFKLKEFLCKQAGGYPKYLLLKSRLLLKLEMVIDRMNEAGVNVDHVVVMSAYRTPFYNKAIGNDTTYSRHSYGDAADIYIDNDGNGWMDDITGDGHVTVSDAKKMYNIIDNMYGKSWYRPFIGGLGLYSPRPPVRGPFVHVDTRGYKARW